MRKQAEEKEWEDKEREGREYATRLMAEKQTESNAANRQPANNQAIVADRLRTAQAQAYSQEVAQANAEAMQTANGSPREQRGLLGKLMDREKELAKKAGGKWKRSYIILLFGAMLVDAFSLIFVLLGILVPPIVIVSDVISTFYSAIRFMILNRINKGAPKNEEGLRNLRTFSSGIFKLIPVAGALPIQTITMITEWQIQKATSAKNEKELRDVRKQFKDMGWIEPVTLIR